MTIPGDELEHIRDLMQDYLDGKAKRDEGEAQRDRASKEMAAIFERNGVAGIEIGDLKASIQVRTSRTIPISLAEQVLSKEQFTALVQTKQGEPFVTVTTRKGKQ